MSEAKRILVVEDEEIILADLTRQLRRHGYIIAATASSAEESVQAAATATPDIVLMDVRLKGRLNGMDAARMIRQISDVPILFVTAHANSIARRVHELKHKCAVLVKPFSPNQLHEAIEMLLS